MSTTRSNLRSTSDAHLDAVCAVYRLGRGFAFAGATRLPTREEHRGTHQLDNLIGPYTLSRRVEDTIEDIIQPRAVNEVLTVDEHLRSAYCRNASGSGPAFCVRRVRKSR